jgi:hypothetical protein
MNKTWFLMTMGLMLGLGCGQGATPPPSNPPTVATPTAPVVAQAAAPAPATDPSLVITPGAGVGELKYGMTPQDIERILGQPDRMNGTAREYLKKGMVVMFSRSGTMSALMFGDSNSAQSPLVKACQYKTDAGIGMGSTLEEIKKAYGEPTSPPKTSQVRTNSYLTISYESLGADFTLIDGKLVHMSFHR